MNVSPGLDIGARLAERTRALPPLPAESRAQIVVPPSILDAVREALLAGETHYTSRPGLPELRARIAGELVRRGAPSYNPDTDVIVTAGEREAVFVALLGLRVGTGIVATAGDIGPYLSLFELMGVTPAAVEDAGGASGSGARLVYRACGATETLHARAVGISADAGLTDIVNLGELVGAPAAARVPDGIGPRSVLLGGLDTLPGQDAFGCGFVAAPSALLVSIRTWKQAFSICTAAPSQRAAFLAMTATSGAGANREETA